VDEIRCELAQAPFDRFAESIEGQVETKVRVYADGERAASQLHDLEWPALNERLAPGNAHAEEGILAAQREGAKLSRQERAAPFTSWKVSARKAHVEWEAPTVASVTGKFKVPQAVSLRSGTSAYT
jgi:hypothetical protein